jgi:cell division septal protein FtsQ
MSKEDWEKLDIRARRTIQLFLADSVLLNVSKESTAKELWDNLGNLYQSKSLVKKKNLRKKQYHLSMEDGYSVREHLNAFNTLVSQLVSTNITIVEEDKCITLLFSLQNLGII